MFGITLLGLLLAIAVGVGLWMALDNAVSILIALPFAAALFMLTRTPHTMTIDADGIAWYAVGSRSALRWKDIAAAGSRTEGRATWVAARLRPEAPPTPRFGYPALLGDRRQGEGPATVGLFTLTRPGRRPAWDVSDDDLVKAVRRRMRKRWQDELG